ncbi:MAG: protein-glutamine glutaminase family protein [Candidatus Nitricoxidivorans perseverans]|uniref:Protein-glutamine glutaminase family protein n=1 Tax=Candidatus Nitricoxidivorans perseverans TaxID=2975601 RepID=A0AA49FLC2_9PROT|nr:MAG: protein-glutamine glutaminase family protein [Candidatus Nitricoxidivorans perseverans]
MRGQKRLIDGIHSVSPTRDLWMGKPTEDLPGKVAVRFRTGQSGLLDMSSPRAAHWAGVIDELERAGQPVYVEIDEETGVITNVRIPRRHRVERIDPDERGNLMVRLRASSAIHWLLRSDPGHEAMRASLQAALGDGSERLITETRDEHEIIAVSLPEAAPGGPGMPAPLPLPDPPVSETRAADLFGGMAGRSCSPCNPAAECISFLYPDDGCWIRAHIMCHLMRAGGPDTTTNPPEDPEKVWINASTWLDAPTVNHPDCRVIWGWHVAPTLTVILPAGNEKRVIDPSLSPAPESEAAWKGRQGDPGATLTDTAWTDYNWIGDNTSVSLAQAHQAMQYYRDELRDRCLDIGPPPYSCTRNCFFIIDRSTFSDDEVEAMLHISAPAVVPSALYVVVDGFSPYELGFSAATMQHIPALNVSPSVAGMTITPVQLAFEHPSHLNRRQRLTWVYDVSFANTGGFTSEQVTVTLQATMATVSCTGYLYLVRQPNPYEIDGQTSWLSTDLRVFRIEAGQSKFGVAMGSNPSAFITQVIANLNGGNTGGQTFDNDISVDQQASRLELSGTVGGTPVFNFAVAKVRYRALAVSAADVRVFFRLFPVATTSLEYEQATTYRRHAAGGAAIPLLGIKNGEVAAIPCFASPRIDSAVSSMTAQTDAPNVQTLPPNPSGAEVVRYFGCWLDINQTQPQFPIQPVPVDGPYPSGRVSIQDLIRNEHQCLVSEIAFAPAPAQNGATPSVSDKLAQRNLAIVESANPGLAFSRRIPQTFEIRPSTGGSEHDELMIDWGNLPAGSVATLHMPGLSANGILLLAARKYRSHRLLRIDEHTLKFEAGGITYLPIPFTEGNLPGMLTVDLPEGIKKGQVFKVVVRQVAAEARRSSKARVESRQSDARHVVGSFQLTIPVRAKAEILPGQQRLLSNLRWIERAIPAGNRWAPVFARYVAQVADRVDALGGDAGLVAPSASGQWREAYRTCLLLTLAAILLVAALVVCAGVLSGGAALLGGIPVAALLARTVCLWRKKCRPTDCQLLRALLAGSVAGAALLALLAAFGTPAPHFIAALTASAVVAVAAAIAGWVKGCLGCGRCCSS